jgi:O-antigen/teichoic acid export membrane protein
MTFSVGALVRRTIDRVRPRELTALAGGERSRERNRRVALTAAASAFATGVRIVVALVSIPLTVRYLGAEQYGLWVTIASVTALLGFADLGLSSGLVNGISETQASDDEAAARRYVASTFYLLTVVALVLGAVFAAVYGSVQWSSVFNVTSSAAEQVAGPATAVFVVVTLIGLPVGIAPRIRSGYQEGWANGIWDSVASVVSLVALVIAIAVGASLTWLVLALGGGVLVSSLLNGASIVHSRPWLRPRVRDVTRGAAGRMLRLGVLFFIVQVAGVAAVQTDNIVIARLLGAESVAQYAIPMRLFLFVPLVSNLVVTPLWPAYREALMRRDSTWVTRTVRRSLLGAGAWGLLVSTLLVLLGGPIVRTWAGGDISPDGVLLLALGAFSVLLCVGQALAVFLNAANVVGFQAICLSVMVAVNLALSIVLTNLIGISGPAWGSAISLGLVVVVPYAVYVRSSMARLSRSSEVASDRGWPPDTGLSA